MLLKMTTIMLILSVVVPMIIYVKGEKKNAKTALISNIAMYFTSFTVMSVLIFSRAFAQEAVAVSSASGLGFLAAGLATGLATVGAGIAVGAAASAALGAISENEKIFGKALIFVALAEGVALYGLLISLLILNKL